MAATVETRAELGPEARGWSRWTRSLRAALGVLLALGALYILVIARFSPHPLPGLSLIALSVFVAGAMMVVSATRFRRMEIGLCLVAVLLAAGGFTQVAMVGATSHLGGTPRSVH